MYPAMSSQSAMPEPLGCGRHNSLTWRRSVPVSTDLIFLFHLGHDSTATAVTKNKRLPHNSGRDAQKNASPAKYVNHELTSSPTRMAAAQRCATETKL